MFRLSALLKAAPIGLALTLGLWTGSAHALARGYRDGDIARFERHDRVVWRNGYWHHGWHDGRIGWWWIAGGGWYFYPQPIYPYPDPYTPPVVIVQQQPVAPAAPPAPVGPPPTQYWYYCDSPKGYYPYVPTCQTAWQPVPATPPAAAPAR